MKKFTLVTLVCLTFAVTCSSQTTDSVYSETKQNGVWQKSQLDIATRDASCNIGSLLSLVWNEGSQSWVNSLLSTYTFSKTGKNSEVFQQSWDAASGTWVNFSKSAIVYSEGGSKFNYTYQMWDAGSNAWINNYRIIQNFDDQGRVVLNEFDNYFDNAWQKIQRGLYSYDANGFVSVNIFQMWMNNEWLNNSKTTYDYTNGVNHGYLWDNGNHVWVRFNRSFNEYLDGTSIVEKSRGQIYTGTWENTYRTEATDNSYNEQLLSFTQNWDAAAQAWINASKFASDYYDDGSEHHFSFEGWDTNTNSWWYGFKSTSTDINCSQTVQLIPVPEMQNNIDIFVRNKNENYLIHRMPATKTNNIIQRTFNPLASDAQHLVYDLNFNRNGKLYAYELILSTAKPQSAGSKTAGNAVAANNRNFAISPNPAKNYFNINLSAYKNAGDIILKISDVSGKLIMQQRMNAGTQRVNISSLQKGMYIIAIVSGKEMQTQKLVVE